MRFMSNIWILLVILSVLSACSMESTNDSNNKSVEVSEESLREIQNPMFELVREEGVVDAIGCGVMKDDDGAYYLYLEVREEDGIDYEAYKEHIYKVMEFEFPLVYELIPFPEEPSIHGLVYDMNTENDYDQQGFIGNVLIFSTDRFLNDLSPDAVWASITDKTEIIDQNGKKVFFEDIKEGMTVSSFYRGMTLTTYPGQQGCEKLVIDTSISRDLEGVPLSGEVVLGEGGIFQEGTAYTITLKMSEGNYKWRFTEKDGLESGWLGNCRLVLSKGDEQLAAYSLSSEWPDGMLFDDTFTIYTKDYDDNGITEILIGQYIKDNIYSYQLYGVSEESIFKYGGYEALNAMAEVEDWPAYSIELHNEDQHSWSYNSIDNTGSLISSVIKFDGSNIYFVGN